MARLWHSGAELGHEHAEGLTLSGTVTFDTGTKRTGTRSFKFETSTTAYLTHTISGGATNRDYYAVAHIYIPSASGYPSISSAIMRFTNAASFICSLYLTTTGTLQLWDNADSAQVGSDSAVLAQDTWHRVEIHILVDTSTTGTLEAKLNGTTFASTTSGNAGSQLPAALLFGWRVDPGTSEVIFFDDLALNDSTGSVNNTWVGDNKVYALWPTADSALGNWTDGNAGTTNIFGSVDNIPPAGEAASGTTAASQVENATSAAGSNFDATMTTYTAAGIGSTDLITALYTVIEAGNSSGTGSDTLNQEVVSNPAIAATSSSCDILAGVYPSAWIRTTGTMTENPTVTKGTAPVMRITKNVATTRRNCCCLMAMSVAVLPNGSPAGTRYSSIMMVG
jgi:hypothetical protein